MWDREDHRIALLELLEDGVLRKRAAQAEVWKILDEMSWTRRTGRRDEIELITGQEHNIVELLNRVWPPWRTAREALADRGLRATPADWRRLQDLIRAERVTTLPERLNQRTAISAVGPHSKSSLTAIRRAALGATTLTRDGIVRMRMPPGIRLARSGAVIDAAQAAHILGEIAITERALLDGTSIEGQMKAALTVENLGPYRDMVAPQGWLILHVPGWDTATARLIFHQLPDVPVVHFGDLDPTGVRIFRHLENICPQLRWAIPDFWTDYVPARALKCVWPPDATSDDDPPFLRDLVARGLWLEQETVAMDPRLPHALETLLER